MTEQKTNPKPSEAEVLRKQVDELKSQLSARDNSDVESLKVQVAQLQAAVTSQNSIVFIA